MIFPIPLKKWLKQLVRPLIYRFPPVYLTPAGLHLWFNTLLATRNTDGAVLEIGCYLGATAAVSSKFLKEIHSNRLYYVLDTFGGFVSDQFDSEVKLGGAASLRHHFSNNTPELARWVMDRHGGSDVRMIEGDVAKLPEEAIPERISACLIDIDLAEPIYVALSRIYPRLVSGGTIIVDDCDDETKYKARIGYDRFVTEKGLQPDIRFGKGIVTKA